MTMETATIVPAPGKLKEVLRKLNELAGGHADATVDGSYEITVPEWLADAYTNATAPPKPAPRRRPKKEEEAEQ
jgi:hypothetical protein